MKVFSKILLLVMAIGLMAPMASCSKNTYGGKNYARKNTSSPTIDPVSRKSQPVRKNYVLPDKKKKILGQRDPKI